MRTIKGRNTAQVKHHNRQAILLELLRAPLSRIELADELGLSAMTVTNQINELLAKEWVVRDEEIHHDTRKKTRRGRPRIRLRIDSQAAYVIGVHIGIGSYRVAQVDLLGNLMICFDQTFDTESSATLVLNMIGTSIKSLISKANLKHEEILGIGFGASGLIDTEQGINVFAPSLGWKDVPIAQFLSTQVGLPVVVENNVRAMALAESYFGLGRDIKSLAFIFGRIGVGAGLVMQGDVIRGTRAGAGEIGHTTIIPTQGAPCRCGQRGCLETLVTQPILVQNLMQVPSIARVLSNQRKPVEQLDYILNLARDGQKEVRQEIERIARYLGIALSNLVNTLNPECIIMGGMYAQGADLFLPLLRQYVAQSAFGGLGEHVRIETTLFGLDAGVIGAASVALAKLFYESDSNLVKV